MPDGRPQRWDDRGLTWTATTVSADLTFVLRHGLFDVVMPDVKWVGGIGPVRKARQPGLPAAHVPVVVAGPRDLGDGRPEIGHQAGDQDAEQRDLHDGSPGSEGHS